MNATEATSLQQLPCQHFTFDTFHHLIRRAMKAICFVLLLIGTLAAGCTTNYYFVRHAEKLDTSSNPPLSTSGQQRALALRDSLLGKGIDSIFATPFLRTQQTAQPLANALGKPVTIYSPDTTEAFVTAISKIRGKDLLVVGHSNTVPAMVLQLTGQQVSIADDQYDRLFIVTITRAWFQKRVTLLQARYGPPSG